MTILDQIFIDARCKMNNSENFINSTLKVTASEQIDLEKELLAENILNKTLSELLEENNDEKKE
jgi:hypothetical protein